MDALTQELYDVLRDVFADPTFMGAFARKPELDGRASHGLRVAGRRMEEIRRLEDAPDGDVDF
jgi:hypothetical protein